MLEIEIFAAEKCRDIEFVKTDIWEVCLQPVPRIRASVGMLFGANDSVKTSCLE